jgi:transcriptional regulator with XRE-family HTH domain
MIKQISQYYVDFIYRIQLRRIALDLTQEELSFLIGRPSDYVGAIETFENDREYHFSDIQKLRVILGDELISTMFANNPTFYSDKEPIFKFNVCEDRYYIYREVYKLTKSGSEQVVYKLIEDKPEYRDKPKNIHEFNKEVEACLDKALKKGVFDEFVHPMYIYFYCRRRIKVNFRPRAIIPILENYAFIFPCKLKRSYLNGSFYYSRMKNKDDSNI